MNEPTVKIKTHHQSCQFGLASLVLRIRGWIQPFLNELSIVRFIELSVHANKQAGKRHKYYQRGRFKLQIFKTLREGKRIIYSIYNRFILFVLKLDFSKKKKLIN